MESNPAQTGTRRFGVRDLIAIYAASFRTDITLTIAYRGSVAIWLLGLILQPLVSLVVWTTVAESRGGTVGGFTASQYAAYFIVLMIVDNLTFTWIMYEFEGRIQSGLFSTLLLRPIHPIHQDVTTNLSFKLIGLTGVLPAAVILTLAFDADFRTSPLDVIVFVPALVMAMALRFMLEWTLGLLAFWMTRTSGVFQVYYSTSLLLAGNIAPLWLYPDAVQTIASILPFRWMVFFPVEVLLGQASGQTMALGLLAQGGWLALALLGWRSAWKLASSRYAAVGG